MDNTYNVLYNYNDHHDPSTAVSFIFWTQVPVILFSKNVCDQFILTKKNNLIDLMSQSLNF